MNAIAKLGATAVGALLIGALGFLIVLYGVFAGGYVASQVWAWHILPLGLGLPALGWKSFWAIGAVSRLCFGSSATQTESTKDNWKMVGALIAPWIIFALAWLLK